MKTKEIIDLIDFIAKSEINEVNIETSEFKVFVKKKPDIQIAATESHPISPVISHVSGHAAGSAPQEAKPKETQAPDSKKEKDDKLVEIRSPMIGTYYHSPNPDSPPFVQVGDKVKQGQTVCIIEAMKLFNEIESEVSGTIVKVLVENSSPVEYDQPLFLIEPS